MVFWEVCFTGVFVFFFRQAPSTEHIRLEGVGGYIWKLLQSPCPLWVFNSENAMGVALWGVLF